MTAKMLYCKRKVLFAEAILPKYLEKFNQVNANDINSSHHKPHRHPPPPKTYADH